MGETAAQTAEAASSSVAADKEDAAAGKAMGETAGGGSIGAGRRDRYGARKVSGEAEAPTDEAAVGPTHVDKDDTAAKTTGKKTAAHQADGQGAMKADVAKIVATAQK